MSYRHGTKSGWEACSLHYQSEVSILGPVGYGPTTLPLRHSDAGAQEFEPILFTYNLKLPPPVSSFHVHFVLLKFRESFSPSTFLTLLFGGLLSRDLEC